MSRGPRLAAHGICRRFGGVVALDGVDLDVPAGQVTAVIGENGAGKSTLMRILAGVGRPDRGELLRDGQPVSFRSVRDAEAHGIALIHQELNLCDNLSVGANVLLGQEPRGVLGWISPRAIERRAAPFLARVGLDMRPSTPLRRLSLGQRQLVEIAKALSRRRGGDGPTEDGDRVLIMDEPTSSLSAGECERLFAVIGELRQQGVAVVYISHRLEEVARLADRVVGLRDGRNSGELDRGAIDHRAMVRLMVGRDIEVEPRVPTAAGAAVPVLEVDGLRTTAFPGAAVSLAVRRGEIVGLAGLVGSGRSELLESVFGARRVVGGTVRVEGDPVVRGSVRAAMAAGMALVPEDRKDQGLMLAESVEANVNLATLPAAARRGWLSRRQLLRRAAAQVEGLSVRTASVRQAVGALSGGNQQKIVLGRWLQRDPALLLLDEPTRGVDIGAKDEIYRQLDRLAAAGMAILFASSELAEVLALADRIFVMRDGVITGELSREAASEEAIMALATGGASTDGLGGTGEMTHEA